MEESDALAALSALANPLRLAAFRRLVVAGREGLAAGALAEALGTPPSTLSSALSLLESARLDGLRDLLRFLIEDCCGGRPDLCRPALDSLALPEACC